MDGMFKLMASSRLDSFEISSFFLEIVDIIDGQLGHEENGAKFERGKLEESEVYEEQQLLVLLRHAARILAEQSSWCSLLLFFALTNKYKEVLDTAKHQVTRDVQDKTREIAERLRSEQMKFVEALDDFIGVKERRDLLSCATFFKPEDKVIPGQLRLLTRDSKAVDYLYFSDALKLINTPFAKKLMSDEERDDLRNKVRKGKAPANENEGGETPAAAAAAVDDDDDDIVYPPSYKKPRKTTVFTVVDSDGEEN